MVESRISRVAPDGRGHLLHENHTVGEAKEELVEVEEGEELRLRLDPQLVRILALSLGLWHRRY